MTDREKRLYPPTVWSYNWDPLPDGTRDPRHGKVCREVPYDIYHEAVAENEVGDLITHWASAPGTGRTTYRVTRIDETGVYAVLVESTVRELTIEDVI